MIRPRITRFPYRSRRVRREIRPTITALALGGLAGMLSLIVAVPALAGGSGSVTATINVAPPAAQEVIVSPATVAYGGCVTNTKTSTMNELTVPNGKCITTTPITIANTGSAGQIDVTGTAAIPSQANGGQSWTLCGAQGVACSNAQLPGLNQYTEETLQKATNGPENLGVVLGTSIQCDTAFDESTTSTTPGCAATSGQSQKEEFLSLTGPEKSSDTSAQMTTSVTWTAVP